MPRFRLTLRWLMLLVFLAALALRVAYLRREYAPLAAGYRRLAGNWRLSVASPNFGDSRNPALAREIAENTRWHEEMALKYERAARYPWLPIPADTPQPQ